LSAVPATRITPSSFKLPGSFRALGTAHSVLGPRKAPLGRQDDLIEVRKALVGPRQVLFGVEKEQGCTRRDLFRQRAALLGGAALSQEPGRLFPGCKKSLPAR